jgi:hypothetical protein
LGRRLRRLRDRRGDPGPPAPPLDHRNIKGESYRLREKLKAGLLKPKLGADHGSDADATTGKP